MAADASVAGMWIAGVSAVSAAVRLCYPNLRGLGAN
jgi:hypothetical protein